MRALNSRPPMRAILAAWGACFVGEAIAAVAFGVIACESAGATGVALLVAVQLLPTAVLAPVLVAMAERWRRERLALAVDLSRTAVAAVAAVLSEAGAPREACSSSPRCSRSVRPCRTRPAGAFCRCSYTSRPS